MSDAADLLLPPPDAAPYHGYRLIPVYRQTTAELRAAAINFWFRYQALSEPCVADRRSHELVYVAMSAQERIAGLTSVSLGRRTADGRNVFNLRIFIAPADRVAYLMRELTNRTRELLRHDCPGAPAGGLCLVADNPKLVRPGIRRYLLRQGYLPCGPNRAGLDQWFAPFDGTLAG